MITPRLQPSCSVPRQQAAADDVTTDYLGTAVERVQQLRWVAGAVTAWRRWPRMPGWQVLKRGSTGSANPHALHVHMLHPMFCSEAAHGGQVIVSEKAWAAVQDQLPGQPHVSWWIQRLPAHSACQCAAAGGLPHQLSIAKASCAVRRVLTALARPSSPPSLQVVSLGSHILDHSPASHPLLLMEVMPQGGWAAG